MTSNQEKKISVCFWQEWQGKEDLKNPNLLFARITAYIFSVFFSQGVDKWTSPHSLSEDSIVVITLEAACHSQLPNVAEQAQKQAGMEES